MQAHLKIKTIVVNINSGFNLNTFDKYFFVQKDIFSAEDIIPEKSFFSTQIVSIVTQKIHLQISGLQLIITSLDPANENDGLPETLIKILNFGNVQGITNSGLNFNWFLSSENETTLQSLTKKLFYNENNLIQKTFFSDDNYSSFGFYSSKDFLGTRLKLNVQPIKYQEIDKKEMEAIQFGFNYHKDFTNGQGVPEFIETLKNYNTYSQESKKIISVLN